MTSPKRLLILGSTGLLGQEVSRQASKFGWTALGAARSGADISVDLADLGALSRCITEHQPDLVVNCAAIVDLAACEHDPGRAYLVNARPVALLAEWSKSSGGQIVQVSTDHFFLGEGPIQHAEDAPVNLLNEYARSKYIAELFALNSPRALVLRTSIVGVRGWPISTFAEWALDVVERDLPVTLFSDAFTSSVDTRSFVAAMFELIDRGTVGLMNLAARDVYSKEAFVREMARQKGRRLRAKSGKTPHSELRRATSLGLDVSRASRFLSRPLPSLEEVVASVLEQANQQAANEARREFQDRPPQDRH